MTCSAHSDCLLQQLKISKSQNNSMEKEWKQLTSAESIIVAEIRSGKWAVLQITFDEDGQNV
jgi:hypothetical protein